MVGGELIPTQAAATQDQRISISFGPMTIMIIVSINSLIYIYIWIWILLSDYDSDCTYNNMMCDILYSPTSVLCCHNLYSMASLSRLVFVSSQPICGTAVAVEMNQLIGKLSIFCCCHQSYTERTGETRTRKPFLGRSFRFLPPDLNCRWFFAI